MIRTRIVRIGNSRGIRIPRLLLEQTGLTGEVEIRVKDHSLIISPAAKPRQGWDEAFRRMAASGDDILLDGDVPSPSSWDEEDWGW